MSDGATLRLDGGLPDRLDSVPALEELLTRPSDALQDALARAPGDILVLGAGGKMGPTLCRLARRAAPDRQIIAVARFTEPGTREGLQRAGVETVACDLLDRNAVDELPDAPNVVFMAGRKFGSTGAAHLTWAMNALVPGYVAERYRHSRIVAFSTGCVYPFSSTRGHGSIESDPTLPPPGTYAWSCLARERVFEHGSHRWGTPGRLLRLNYAIALRYGVLHDIAAKVRSRQPVDVSMGHVNVIWQGDANDRALRALAHCTTPTSPLNVTGPEVLSVRDLAQRFAELFGVEARITGVEASEGWLNDSSEAIRLMGRPTVPIERMIAWQAAWLDAGLPDLGKPTHFEVRDGRF